MTEIKIGRSAANRITMSFPYYPAYFRCVNIYGWMLWVVVLSIVLLLEEKRPGAFR